jgi:hypothetical protein
MSEFKVEVGKFVFVETFGKCIVLSIDKNGYARLYCYEKDNLKFLSIDFLKEYKEEPKVGWVYEDIYGHPIRIIAKYSDYGFAYEHDFMGIDLKCGEIEKYNYLGKAYGVYNLKLETGMPADD